MASKTEPGVEEEPAGGLAAEEGASATTAPGTGAEGASLGHLHTWMQTSSRRCSQAVREGRERPARHGSFSAPSRA